MSKRVHSSFQVQPSSFQAESLLLLPERRAFSFPFLLPQSSAVQPQEAERCRPIKTQREECRQPSSSSSSFPQCREQREQAEAVRPYAQRGSRHESS